MTSQHTIRYSTCSVQCSSILIRWSHYWLVIVHPRWMIQDRTCSHICRWVFNIHYLYNNFASIIVLVDNWEISILPPSFSVIFVSLLWWFSFDDHSVSYYWYTMNCCALITIILYLDKACMGESTIPITFKSRLKDESINHQANFIISAQWYKTFRGILNSCIFRYQSRGLRPLDRYRKMHEFKDPLLACRICWK